MAADDIVVPVNPTKMEDAQSKLDQEISSMISRIAELRTRRNELSPIASIQLEVLAEVFWFAICYDATEFSSTSATNITKLSTVCRKWRAVIRNNPRLWSQIDTRSDRRMQEMLQMSKCALLELRVDFNYGGNHLVKRIQTALSSPTRKFTLVHLRGSPRLLSQVCQDIPPQCLTQLESLYLEKHWGSDETTPLPPALRDCLASRLSSLRLDGFFLPSDGPLLSAGVLVRLEVTLPDIISRPVAGRGTIDQLIDLLATLPKLQYLVLKHALPPTPSSPYSHSRIVLPNLVSITLHGTVRECAQLLNLLDVRTCIRLVVDAMFDTTEEVSRLIPAFASMCTYPDLHTLSLTVDYGVNIIGWQSISNSPVFDLQLKAAPALIHGWTTEEDGILTAMSTFLRGNMAGLQILNLLAVSDWRITRQQWTDTFAFATNIDTLHLDNLAIEDVIEALGDPSAQKSPQTDIPAVENASRDVSEGELLPPDQKFSLIMWTKLKTITFEGIVIPFEGKPLVDVLRQRADAGFALESISVQACYVSEVLIASLEEVAAVDWDGLEEGCDDSETGDEDDDDEDDGYDGYDGFGGYGHGYGGYDYDD